MNRSGIYQFYISSGEEGFFRLSRDQSPENLPPLDAPTLYSTCCEILGADSPFESTKRSIKLLEGQAYFFDLAFTLIDQPGWFQVGWVTPSGTVFDLKPIPGNALSRPAVSNPIEITRMPQSQTVTEGQPAFFTVSTGATPNPSFGYQWYKNGRLLPDATSHRLNLPSVTLEDHGNRYAVELHDPGFQFDPVMSSEAILTVEADSDPPVFNGVHFNRVMTEITLKFNERLDPDSAEDVSNYSVAPNGGSASLMIHSAELQPNGKDVKLVTEEQRPTIHEVTVSGIQDRSANRNTLKSSSSHFGRDRNGGPLLFDIFGTFAPGDRSTRVPRNQPIAFFNRTQRFDSRSVRLFVNGEVVVHQIKSTSNGWDLSYIPTDGWPASTKIKVLMTHSKGEISWSFTTGTTPQSRPITHSPPPTEPSTPVPSVQVNQVRKNVNLLSTGVLLSTDHIEGDFRPTFGDHQPFQPGAFRSKQFFRAEPERIQIVARGKVTTRRFGTILAIEGTSVHLELQGADSVLDSAFSIEWFLNGKPVEPQIGALIQPTDATQRSLVVSRLVLEPRLGFSQPFGVYWARLQTNSGDILHSKPVELVAVKQIILPENFDPSRQTPVELEAWVASASNRLIEASDLYDFTGNGTVYSRQAYPPKNNAIVSELRATQIKPTLAETPFTHLTRMPSQALGIHPFTLFGIDSGMIRFGALASQDGEATWLPLWSVNPSPDTVTVTGFHEPPEEIINSPGETDLSIAVGIPTSPSDSVYRALYYWEP